MSDYRQDKATVESLIGTIQDDPGFSGDLRNNLRLSGWSGGEEADSAGSPSIQDAMKEFLRTVIDRAGGTHAMVGFYGASGSFRFMWSEGFGAAAQAETWAGENRESFAAALAEKGEWEGSIDLPEIGADPEMEPAKKPGQVVAVPIRTGDCDVGILLAGNTAADPYKPDHWFFLKSAAFLIARTMTEIWEKNQYRSVLYSMIQSLAAALDARDSYTRGHSDRVAMYAMAIANELGIDDGPDRQYGFRDQLRLGALLHDIGKVGIGDDVLLKPDKLTDEEMDLMREHPVTGAEIIRSATSLDYVLPGILYHHERWDGTGYPMGVSGDEIPLVARITGIADVFDALTTARPYREPMTHSEAMRIIQEGSGKMFDPEIAEAMVRVQQKGVLGTIRVAPVERREDPEAETIRITESRGDLADQIPSLPSVVQTVTQRMQDPECSSNDIAEVLTTDEGLVVRVLKIANSAFYALPGRVGTIPMAITLLGMTTLRNIVIGTAMGDLARSLFDSPDDAQRLWDHGVEVGVWCRAIAHRVGGTEPEEAFTAGLLHDIGKGLVLRELPQKHSHLKDRLLESSDSRVLEREAVGFDHAQLGGWATARWRLPAPLVKAVRYHHEPRVAPEEDGEGDKLVWISHVSDILSRKVKQEPVLLRMMCDRHADPLVHRHLPLRDRDFFEELLPRVTEDLEVARQLVSGMLAPSEAAS